MKTIFAICNKDLEKIEIEISRLDDAIAQYKSGANPFESFHETDKNYWFSMIIAMPVHSAYCGIETVLERLIKNIDGKIQSGEEYHKEIILAASVEVIGIRPAIISNKTLEDLDRLRAFRHVIRKRYTQELGLDRIIENGELMVNIFPVISSEIKRFQEAFDDLNTKPRKRPAP